MAELVVISQLCLSIVRMIKYSLSSVRELAPLTRPVAHDIPLLVILPTGPCTGFGAVPTLRASAAPRTRVSGDVELKGGHGIAAEETIQDTIRTRTGERSGLIQMTGGACLRVHFC